MVGEYSAKPFRLVHDINVHHFKCIVHITFTYFSSITTYLPCGKDQPRWLHSICRTSPVQPSMSWALANLHNDVQHVPKTNYNKYKAHIHTNNKIHEFITKTVLMNNNNNKEHNYLCNRLQVACRFQLVNSMTFRFSVGCTLWYWAFTATTANTNSENNVSCK